MWTSLLLVASLCVAQTLSQTLTLQQQTCDASRKHVSVNTANANVILGGLFDIREPGSDGTGCAFPSKELMQVYEAARWTISQLNSNNYVSGVRFGMEAYDTCTRESNVLAGLQDFYPQLVGSNRSSNLGTQYCTTANNVYKLGVIGPMRSSASMFAGEFVLPNVPASTVSMRTSSPELSNKEKYPTFLRTDQPVSFFARAVGKLMKELRWEKIVFVRTDNAYGLGGYQEMLGVANEMGICISGIITVLPDGSVDDYENKLRNIGSYGATAAVFYGDPTDAVTLLRALQRLQSQPGVSNIKWLFGELDAEGDFSSFASAQGAISVRPTTTTINSFRTYYTNLNVNNPPAENPWLQDWYMNKYQCKLPGVTYAPFNTMQNCQTSPNPRTNDFRQSPFVEQTILAILAYAEAIKRVCATSSNPTGVCSTLANMDPIMFHKTYLSRVNTVLPVNFFIPELRQTRLAFDVNGDPLRSAFTFYSYNNNNFQEFATYNDGTLQVSSTPTFPRQGGVNLPTSSQCSANGCTNCLHPATEVTLAYKPGDVVIAALVDAHEAGSQGLSCGETIPDRLIDAVAVRYGASVTNALGNRGVSVGYLIVDVCPGLASAQSFLTNLLGGYKLYTDSIGNIITTNNIVAFLDMTREDTAWKLAPTLASMGMPQIRVASTSRMLLRNRDYPLMLSAVPAQDRVQLAVVQMLNSLDWKYVQIISEPEGIYYRAAENFRRLASRMEICVAMWSTFGMDAAATVRRLREVQGAPVVVVFGSSTHWRSLLEGVKAVTDRQLTFVSGSEEFGKSENVIAGYNREAAGSILLQLAEQSNSQFDTWLTGQSLSDIVKDVFLAQWFEEKYSCSLTSAGRRKFDSVCPTSRTISSGDVYQGYSPYILKAVDSVAVAVNGILNSVCQTGSSGVCSQFRGLSNIGERIVSSLRDSNDNTEFKIMNKEGMSDILYFSVNTNGGFVNAGRFDTDTRRISNIQSANILIGNGNNANTLTTKCTGRCTQCQYAYSYQEYGYIPGDYLVAGTFSVSDPGPTGQRPYVCGEARTSDGFQYTAAVMYALNKINSGGAPISLNNVTLGALLMDHCNNERRAYGQVSDVYSGLTELTWQQTMGNTMSHFMSSDILAWLTDTTASTREAAEILQPVGVGIVSPSATAASLMDNPTFFRTVQGDATAAMAIIKLCKTLGFSYIQVVYAPNSYGREGLDTLRNTARQEGICVVNQHELASENEAQQTVTRVAAGTTRVVVLYLGTSLMQAFLQEASLRNTNEQLTIISPHPYSGVINAIPNRNRLNNLLSLQLQNPTISDFNNYLNTIANHDNNPFFARYYMKRNNCNLPGYYMFTDDCPATISNLKADEFDLSTINAVYSVVAALQTTLIEFCGSDYSGVCPGFLQSPAMYSRFVENLKIVEFQDPSNRLFRFLDREGNVNYDVLRYTGTQYSVVGTYGGASLRINDLGSLEAQYSGVISQCTDQCTECIFNRVEFSHTPGDIYLAGIFDVHQKGQGVFDCGMINTEHGFQLLEAFHFALQQVNTKQGIFANVLNGVTLGGVGLDACQSAIRGGYLVSNINNGLTKLVRDGTEVSPAEIDVYIGSYSSDSSIYLARILSDLRTPQISYASTSNALENQLIYPYFFRTVPADDKQVLGMLKYLDMNDLRYVQLLYTDDSYGNQGVAQFDLLIKKHGFSVCVAQRVVFPESGIVSKESSDNVVVDLLQKPVANTVVIFAGTSYIRAFLQAVGRSPDATNTFKFVGPTTWGDRYAVTRGIRSVGEDAVTFVLDFQGGVGGFLNSYLELRNPTNAGNNPWFEEWFQYTLNCYTTPTNRGLFSQPCGANLDLRGEVIEDNGILHVMNAVYSAAFALDATLTQKCGANYAAVCEAYRSSQDRRTSIRDNLEQVNFTDPTDTEFRFIDRAGNKGYKLFKLVSSRVDTDIIYNRVPIGNFTNDNTLNLTMALVPKYDGSCERKDACVECPTIRNRGVRYAVGGDVDASVTLVGIFDVHNRGTELYQCGSINMEGFMKFLTFFWTYGKVTKDAGIRLLALDTCSNSMRVGQDLYSLLKDGTLCNSEKFDLDKLGMDHIASVMVTGEENTMMASQLLDPLMVTYVSADSVSPLLDSRRYLFRSRTPWSGFAEILSKFLKDSGWTFVNTIYNNGSCGMDDYVAFQRASSHIGVCLNGGGLGLADSPTDANIREVLQRLDASSGANVVVLFTSPEVSMRIMRIAQELGIADDYLWVLGIDDPQILESFPAGVSFQALILTPIVPPRDEFTDYVKNIDYDRTNDDRNRANIPRVWFEEAYQTVHQCRLANAEYPLEFTTECDTDLNPKIDDIDINGKSAHYTYLASALAMLGSSNCQSGESLQQCLNRRQRSRDLIREETLGAVFPELTDAKSYQFKRPEQYVESDYDIFVVDVENGMVKGIPERFKTYSGGDFRTYNRLLTQESICLQADRCGCGSETPIAAAQAGKRFDPTIPRNYYKYDSNGNQVYEWPIWAIVLGVLTCLGLLITLIVFVYLLIAYPIKGGTSVLGYLTIIGIMGIYVVNFAFFLHASDATCGARRFVMGVVYAIVFSSLLVKAVDNWRFANMEYSNNQYRGITNSCTLFLMALGIILIQCIIPIEWLILVHPTASKWSSVNVNDYWWCDPHDYYDRDLVLSFIFVIFLVILTAIFAGLAWDSEHNNRESRWILVSAIATAGCFLVWMIVTTNAGPVYRDPTVAIANFVNASVLLLFIPIRKMHLFCQSKNEKMEDFGDFDPYSNVYANQSYDPEDYTYEPTEKSADDEFINN